MASTMQRPQEEDVSAAAPEELEEVAEELEEFQTLDKLEALGINRGDIKKAKEGGFHTCASLLMSTKKALAEIRGLSEAKIEKMLEAAKKLCPSFGIVTAKEYETTRQREIVHISTGCKALDEILGGGIETKAITEVFGEWRTGKTQLCHTLCVTTQLGTGDDAAGAGKVALIDTEGTFRPERIRPIAERFGVDADAVLNNVIFVRSPTSEHQMEVLTQVAAKMAEDDGQYKLLIVDSVMANFRTEFVGRGELADRQQKLGQMMARLRRIAETYNVAVLVTNQILSDPSGGAMFVSDPKKAAGGHIMAHASTVRLSLRKGKGEQRLLKVVDAPNLPEAEASFVLSDAGINDYKD